MNLRPCPYRRVSDEGHILCDKVSAGDREVSPAICRACPINSINCAHLRATLNHQSRPPLVVRYGNGKTEVWDDPTPPLALERAACSAKVIPILSPRDCAACPIRQNLVATDAIPMMPAAISAPVAKPMRRPQPVAIIAPEPVVAEDSRKNIVAQKIIQLQEWLTKQKQVVAPEPENEDVVLPIAVGMAPVRQASEEKRAGWTD